MPRDKSIVTRSQTGAGPIDWPAELERHGRWLRTVALARVGDAAAADDVMQEVATAAVQKGHQLRDPNSVAAWLYRLVGRWLRCSIGVAKAGGGSWSSDMPIEHRACRKQFARARSARLAARRRAKDDGATSARSKCRGAMPKFCC